MATYPVKWFHSGMQGAPVMSNQWGDMISVLDACLVTGFNLKAVDAITSAGGIATVSIPTGHLFKQDQVILISGCEQAQYNGEQRVLSVTSNTLTYAVSGNPQSPATTQGTIQCKMAPLGWEKAFSGVNKAAYRSLDPASPRHFLRVDDSLKANQGFGNYDTGWAKWANVGICENMTDIDTIVGAQAPFDPIWPEQNWKSRASDHFGWHKWYHGRTVGYETYGDSGAGARQWVIVGDGRLFYFYTTYAPGYNWYTMVGYCFGDPISFKPGDAYGTILQAEDAWSTNSHQSYPGQNMGNGGVFNESLDWAGKVMLKDYTQVGNPIRWGVCSLNTNNGRPYSGGGQGVPWPNGPDFALWLMPTYIRQENGHIRGMMPGARWVLQDRPYSNLSIIENVTNEPGKKFLMVRYNWASEGERGTVAFDITGPWR